VCVLVDHCLIPRCEQLVWEEASRAVIVSGIIITVDFICILLLQEQPALQPLHATPLAQGHALERIGEGR
jgi:hypothetical protein